jgi:hypothetical protein
MDANDSRRAARSLRTVGTAIERVGSIALLASAHRWDVTKDKFAVKKGGTFVSTRKAILLV